MSLLDGPHTVIVIPMKRVRNAYGTYTLVRQTPVPVKRVAVDPFAAGTYGTLESDAGDFNDQLICRGRGEWPGGIKSIIKYDGHEYDTVGVPKIFKRGSRRTRHFVVRMKARGAEVK